MPVGKNKGAISFKPKTRDHKTKKDFPAPNAYNIREDFTYQSRFKEITFGHGRRTDFTKLGTALNYPGPGRYQLPSSFDRYAKTLVKKLPRNKSIHNL